MVLDPELLKKAVAAGERVAEAERQAQAARGDYHTYIRRLSLSGASFREVALALQLSHQRVQQIVQGAGGSWWSRVWKSRQVTRDTVCTFCGGPPSEVAKLIAGPNVYICDRCVEDAGRALGGSSIKRDSTVRIEGAKKRCSFCGKAKSKVRALAGSEAASVCGECLALCRQILDDRKG